MKADLMIKTYFPFIASFFSFPTVGVRVRRFFKDVCDRSDTIRRRLRECVRQLCRRGKKKLESSDLAVTVTTLQQATPASLVTLMTDGRDGNVTGTWRTSVELSWNEMNVDWAQSSEQTVFVEGPHRCKARYVRSNSSTPVTMPFSCFIMNTVRNLRAASTSSWQLYTASGTSADECGVLPAFRIRLFVRLAVLRRIYWRWFVVVWSIPFWRL